MTPGTGVAILFASIIACSSPPSRPLISPPSSTTAAPESAEVCLNVSINILMGTADAGKSALLVEDRTMKGMWEANKGGYTSALVPAPSSNPLTCLASGTYPRYSSLP